MKTNQAQTAIDHFHSKVERMKFTIIQQIIAGMLLYKDKPDWTIGEIAHLMRMEKSTVSARRNEMLHLFLVEYSERRHCSISGVMCETVKIKHDKQIDAFAQLARNGYRKI
jgi:hypothetical protein